MTVSKRLEVGEFKGYGHRFILRVYHFDALVESPMTAIPTPATATHTTRRNTPFHVILSTQSPTNNHFCSIHPLRFRHPPRMADAKPSPMGVYSLKAAMVKLATAQLRLESTLDVLILKRPLRTSHHYPSSSSVQSSPPSPPPCKLTTPSCLVPMQHNQSPLPTPLPMPTPSPMPPMPPLPSMPTPPPLPALIQSPPTPLSAPFLIVVIPLPAISNPTHPPTAVGSPFPESARSTSTAARRSTTPSSFTLLSTTKIPLALFLKVLCPQRLHFSRIRDCYSSSSSAPAPLFFFLRCRVRCALEVLLVRVLTALGTCIGLLHRRADAAVEARKKPSVEAGPRVAAEGLVINEWKERREKYLARQQVQAVDSV
ncbi:Vesicle-associated protein 4-1 isoform A [Glycine soja]|uniref:Vesicle-associated protein 4-1 isoform A n=1 Tax=Glycine soja TaxID=3848 RepID=A0A445IB65_GLYSO|nr:Vesicle-associated protein 4-1 isoform A [Glycine soja]